MEFSWTTWVISVAAVVVSGLIARLEGNWRRRPGLGMGFVNHGGMWGDVLWLPLANSVIVPHLTPGPWILVALAASAAASLAVHAFWYGRGRDAHCADDRLVALGDEQPGRRRGDHMWPARVDGVWWRDLSWSGWAHVVYVVAELTLLAGFATHAMPAAAIVLVAAVFTLHVPIGLLQPRYFLTGHIATASEQPLLLPLLAALWAAVASKW
jgi:hypothetical protein